MRAVCIFACALLFAPGWARAAVNDDLASQRFHFQKAEAALAAADDKAFRSHRVALGDYPLALYLDFDDLSRRLTAWPLGELDAFFRAHEESYLATRLREQLLAKLAHAQRWSDYLRYYRDTLPSTELLCYALTARLRANDASALAEIPAVWDVPRSQPDACDPVFARWKDSGQMTETWVWSRFAKSVEAGNLRLAKYLKKQLRERQPLAELFLQVHKRPTLIKQRDLFESPELPIQQIVAHGVRRMARQEPLDALYHWELYEAQQLFPEQLAATTKHEVVKRLIRGGHVDEALGILSYSHTLRKHDLVEELLREALAEQDWERFESAVALLDAGSRSEERWLYWRARAQDALGRALPNFKPSRDIYTALAGNRSFYGFLSADILGAPYSFVDESEPVSAEQLVAVAAQPGMRRAFELWLLGQHDRARAEWLYTSYGLSNPELLAAGQLARDWGWHTSGIRAMISGNYWNQLTVRFPIAYREQIDREATATSIEPTFIYAIARQESAFDARAKSPVGALGLMQIMPQTAHFTAKTYGLSHKDKSDLMSPEHNVALGSRYLHYLLGRFDNNRILAAAAYNAGPHRVNRWLSEDGKKRPFDIWIETIPFRETRNYVQNVLCFQVIYGYRLGTPVAFVSAAEARSYL